MARATVAQETRAQARYGPPAMRIRLAFSPDSDDIFMFWALLAGKVDAEGLVFEAERADTETLNARAAAGELDVVAVSIARYPAIARDYLLLRARHVGRPRLRARRRGASSARDLASLEGARIGVPGLRTTAYLVLRLLLPRFEPVVVPISPYARAFEAVRAGEVDAALLIHEGRLTYEREGFARVCDSARPGRRPPAGCRCRSAATPSGAGSGPSSSRRSRASAARRSRGRSITGTRRSRRSSAASPARPGARSRPARSLPRHVRQRRHALAARRRASRDRRALRARACRRTAGGRAASPGLRDGLIRRLPRGRGVAIMNRPLCAWTDGSVARLEQRRPAP